MLNTQADSGDCDVIGTAPAPAPTADLATATDCDDWTSDLPDTDHVRFFRETDWSRSKLGALKGWSTTLRLFTRLLFADSRAACLWW